MLHENGLKHIAKDSTLINHFAYLFIREHPVIFEKDLIKFGKNTNEENPNRWITSNKLEDNEKFLKNSNIFEAVQSTNWNNMRFKPAKSFNDKNSWLVEFRPVEIPITSREKFYLIFFTSLMQRIVTDEKLFINFYIPISMADKNSLRSSLRNAVQKQKFFFRKNFYGEKAKDDKYIPKSRDKKDIDKKRKLFIQNEMIEITLEELFLGGENHQGFKGLIETFISLNKKYLEEESKKTKEDIIATIWECFDFFLNRAKGKLLTSSALIRKYVREHPEYAFDSVVEGKLADDLIEFLLKVQIDNHHPDLFLNKK